MENIKDLVIIGSGPAGLSAAVYASRAMIDQVVMEKKCLVAVRLLRQTELIII